MRYCDLVAWIYTRPLSKTYSNCPTTGNAAYNYDSGTYGIGRRSSMGVSGGDYTSWTYNIKGQIESENKQIPGGGQFITSFTYNDAGLPKTMTYPVDNEVVTFGYNNNMQVVSVTGTDAYAQSIAYDSASRMTQIVRGSNILSTVFDYNDWNADGGRLLTLTTTRTSDSLRQAQGNAAILQNATYDYDSVGNINTIVDSLSGPQTQTFQYDELDRVTNSAVSGGTEGLYTEAYSFETGTGNLKSKNGATYTYDATRKHAVTSLSNGNTYSYDPNGNMTDRYIASGPDAGTYEFEYDAENRMVRAEKNSALIGQFFYDADGKQVKTIVNGVTTSYVGNHYEVKGSEVAKYYFAGASRIAIRKYTVPQSMTVEYMLGDHLGSTSITTDTRRDDLQDALQGMGRDTLHVDECACNNSCASFLICSWVR